MEIMKLNIKSRHSNVSPAVKEYAEKKISKMDRFFANIQEIVIDFDILKNKDDTERQYASATVWASGTILRAQETSETLYASIDSIFDKLEKQLKKYNEKLKERKVSSDNKLFAQTKNVKTNENSNHKKSHLQTREYRPKPLSPEDAASIIIEEHLDFLMFRNSTTEEINVIYPTNSGEFELMEP